MANDWQRRIARAVRSYKQGSKNHDVINEYQSALSNALAEGSIDDVSAGLLTAARHHLDTWASENPDAVTAFQQWGELWRARHQIPTELLVAFLARFPKAKAGELNWVPIILHTQERSIIDELLDRRIAKVQDLLKIAKKEPAAFLNSAALDVLIQRGVPAPRSIWKELLNSAPRPEALMPGGTALVRSYSVDDRADASRWLAAFLAETASARESVLRGLLRSAFPAFRFAHHVSLDHAALSKSKRKRVAEANAPVVADWLAICSDEIEMNSEAAPSARIVLGVLQLAASVPSRTLTSEGGAGIRDVTGKVAVKLTIETLRDFESKSLDSVADAVPLVIQGDRLYESVQSYLRSLPLGGSDGGESPERVLRLERHLARKELISTLIEVLDGETELELRDTIEAALFNSGVRPNGSTGERVGFDIHFHESERPGLLRNDPVIVTKPGRILGSLPDGIVLSKAKVALAPES